MTQEEKRFIREQLAEMETMILDQVTSTMNDLREQYDPVTWGVRWSRIAPAIRRLLVSKWRGWLADAHTRALEDRVDEEFIRDELTCENGHRDFSLFVNDVREVTAPELVK